MSIKLDTSNGHPRVPQTMYTQGSLAACYRYIVDTKPVRRQTGSVDRKTEKSRTEFEADFRREVLDLSYK